MKYTINLIDSKWNSIKRNLISLIIPRTNEFIYYEDKYYRVLTVIHKINDKHSIFIIIEEEQNKYLDGKSGSDI